MSNNQNTKNRPEYATGPIICKSWCEERDGHWLKPGDGMVPRAGDQYCSTGQTWVPVSWSEPIIDEDGVHAAVIGVALFNYEAVERIEIDPDAIRGGIHLTRDEWEQFETAGDALWTLADQS